MLAAPPVPSPRPSPPSRHWRALRGGTPGQAPGRTPLFPRHVPGAARAPPHPAQTRTKARVPFRILPSKKTTRLLLIKSVYVGMRLINSPSAQEPAHCVRLNEVLKRCLRTALGLLLQLVPGHPLSQRKPRRAGASPTFWRGSAQPAPTTPAAAAQRARPHAPNAAPARPGAASRRAGGGDPSGAGGAARGSEKPGWGQSGGDAAGGRAPCRLAARAVPGARSTRRKRCGGRRRGIATSQRRQPLPAMRSREAPASQPAVFPRRPPTSPREDGGGRRLTGEGGVEPSKIKGRARSGGASARLWRGRVPRGAPKQRPRKHGPGCSSRSRSVPLPRGGSCGTRIPEGNPLPGAPGPW